MSAELIGVLAGATVLTLLWPGPRPGAPTRLSRLYTSLEGVPATRCRPVDRPPWVRKMPVQPLVSLLRAALSSRYRDYIQRLLRISRLERTHTYEDILAMKVTYVLITCFYFGLILAKRPDPALVIFVLFLATPAYLQPDMWLKAKAQRRQEQIRRELPAILSALAVALEAGLHLMGAVAEVCRDRQGVLAEELRTAVDRHERGVGTAEALEGMAQEVEVAELTMALTGLLQAFAKGSGHVVRAVREQAGEAWRVRKRRAEMLAQTASVKLFLPIALLALPGFMIFLIGPAVLEVVGYFMK